MKTTRQMIRWVLTAILTFWGMTLSFGGSWVDLEGGVVTTGYNDVQIPADTGTRFSLKNDVEQKTSFFWRLQGGYEINGRHALFFLVAPLRIEGSGKLQKSIDFAGTHYNAGTAVKSYYRFDSYRLSYVYSFYKSESLLLGAGLTAKVRDAEISLEDQAGNKATRSNTGFVPLIHLTAEWYFAKGFSFLVDGDGLAAPQGRAEDFLLALTYGINENLKLRIGYRFLEGGSDGGGSVYTFSLFHYLLLGLRYQF